MAFDIGTGVRIDPAVGFLAGIAIREDFGTDRDGWALFGQSSWQATDKIELTIEKVGTPVVRTNWFGKTSRVNGMSTRWPSA